MAVIGANGKARGGSGDKWDACHLLISLQSSANNLPGLTHTHKAGNEAIQPVKDTFHTDTRTHTVKRIKHKQLFTAFTCFSKQQVKAVKA